MGKRKERRIYKYTDSDGTQSGQEAMQCGSGMMSGDGRKLREPQGRQLEQADCCLTTRPRSRS